MVRVAIITALTSFVLAGCCSEEQPATSPEPAAPVAEKKAPAPAPVESAPEAGGDDQAKPAEEAGDEPPKEVKSGPNQDQPPEVPPQEPTDILYELEDETLGDKLRTAGYDVDKETKKIEAGTRFLATKGESKFKIEMVKFETNELADKYMFAVEKNPNAAMGRNNAKIIAVFPGKGTTRAEADTALKTLMKVPERKAAAEGEGEGNPAADALMVDGAPAAEDGPAGGIPAEDGPAGGTPGGDAPAGEGDEARPEGAPTDGSAPAGGEEVPAGDEP